jgi:membrane-bound inhibitor of C-type lysozyme
MIHEVYKIFCYTKIIMKNKNIIVSIAIIVVAVLAVIYLLGRHVTPPGMVQNDTMDANNPSFTFACPSGQSVTATFHIPEDATVDLALSDGRRMSLPHAMSADGARYANADESFVFWNRGMSAFIEENGAVTYENCVAELPGAEQ